MCAAALLQLACIRLLYAYNKYCDFDLTMKKSCSPESEGSSSTLCVGNGRGFTAAEARESATAGSSE